MITVSSYVKKIIDEINGRNRKETIDAIESALSENVEDLLNDDSFFKLPLTNIFSVFSKIDFNYFDESINAFDVLQNIIKNVIKAHNEEKETLLLLHYIDTSAFSLSLDSIVTIVGLFSNCQILKKLNYLYKESRQIPEKDYEYELLEKDKEIKEYQEQININFLPITEKPSNFESNIFRACRDGKLTSVQWLIEKENVSPTTKIESNNSSYNFYKDDTLMHVASQYSHLHIVQYLLQKHKVDINIKGSNERTPLHYACQEGHLPVVQYLIEKGANIEAKDSLHYTPLHYACGNGHLPIV